jgi:hypothetical protein
MQLSQDSIPASFPSAPVEFATDPIASGEPLFAADSVSKPLEGPDTIRTIEAHPAGAPDTTETTDPLASPASDAETVSKEAPAAKTGLEAIVADLAGESGGVAGVAISEEDRWYVTNGVVAIGPVAYELLSRGVEAGRIPSGSFVRHGSWKVWRRVEDIEQLSTSKREEAVLHLAAVSAAAEERASNPYNEPPPPPSYEELERPGGSERPPSMRPTVVDPTGVLASAEDLEQALLLALSTSVAAAGAHVGFLHLLRADLGATVTTFAHGPDAEVLLGERLAADDPALRAAQAGHTVMGEPRLGEAGRYIAGRMARCLPGPRGVAMVPVMVAGYMAAMLEVGRASRPFRAREIARVEDVAEALSGRIATLGSN